MDNCTIPTTITVTQSPISGTVLSGHNTPQIITLIADDGNGNTMDCQFLVTVKDETDPMLTCPADQTIDVDGNCDLAIPNFIGQAIFSDNCTDIPDLTTTQVPTAGTILNGENTMQTITITVNDGNGNSSVCDLILTLNDNNNPTIMCPSDVTIALDDNCETDILDYTDDVIIADNCTDATSITLTQSPAIGTTITGHNFMQIVTVTADDGNGNTQNCIFQITLLDDTNPQVVCPADATIDVDAACEIILNDYISTTFINDNCTDNVDLTIVQTPAAGTVLTGHDFTQIVTITADDGNGNMASCDLTVTLNDAILPTITCPPAVTIAVDAACEITLADYTNDATTDDNCTDMAAILTTQMPVAGTILSGDDVTQTVTLTADDGNGNTETC